MKFKPAPRKGSVLIEVGPEEKPFPQEAGAQRAAAAALFNLKKILVAVDFSEPSRKAAHYGAAFARQFGAELTMLHVIEPYPFVPGMDPVETETIKDVSLDLEKLRRELGSPAACQIALRTGEPDRQLIEAAQELDIDLIIMGTHGRSGLARMLLGGTAEKVVRHADCPVLVVREREQDFVATEVLEPSARASAKNQ